MKTTRFLKAMLLVCSAFHWLSCSSWEEVVAPAEFTPLKIISVSPESAKVGDDIMIIGENFIENKDFDQVWFGGNVRGIIDSATTTKLLLKVPEGAETGILCVSNGIYADTLKSGFEVKKESPFKKASISFGGFKVLMNTSTFSFKDGQYNSSSRTDTINYSKKTFSLIRTTVPSAQYFSNFFENCREVNFQRQPDSVFQNFESIQNSNRKYSYVSTDLDSINRVFKRLTFFYGTWLFTSEGNTFIRYHTECDGLTLSLKNVPYTIVNGKIRIVLDAQNISKYLNIFTGDYGSHNWSTGSGRSDYNTNFNGIYEILPDAHFELTLE